MVWAEYGEALQRVADACAEILATEDIVIAAPIVDLQRCDTGREVVRTDYRRTVHVHLSSDQAFRPPPDGANLIYGVCHEVGHLAIATAVDGGPLPPVVWDEAIAHTMSIMLFLPELERRHGDAFWPVDYPDFATTEASSASGNHEPGQSVSYSDLLERQTAQLRELVEARSWNHALRCVASVAATRPRTTDWWWKFKGRMTR